MLTDLLSGLLENLNYINVMILMAIESSFIPFPSEVVVPPAAYMAAQNGEMNITLVIMFATLGCLIGATINYILAFYVGRPIVYKFVNSKMGHACLLSEEKMLKAENYFDKHGAVATLVGRLIPAVRQLISIPAGLARMNFSLFMLYTFIGAGVWNCVLAGLGWYLQKVVSYDELLETVKQYERPIYAIIIGVVVIAIGYLVVKNQLAKKKA